MADWVPGPDIEARITLLVVVLLRAEGQEGVVQGVATVLNSLLEFLGVRAAYGYGDGDIIYEDCAPHIDWCVSYRASGES